MGRRRSCGSPSQVRREDLVEQSGQVEPCGDVAQTTLLVAADLAVARGEREAEAQDARAMRPVRDGPQDVLADPVDARLTAEQAIGVEIKAGLRFAQVIASDARLEPEHVAENAALLGLD